MHGPWQLSYYILRPFSEFPLQLPTQTEARVFHGYCFPWNSLKCWLCFSVSHHMCLWIRVWGSHTPWCSLPFQAILPPWSLSLSLRASQTSLLKTDTKNDSSRSVISQLLCHPVIQALPAVSFSPTWLLLLVISLDMEQPFYSGWLTMSTWDI